MGQKKQIKKAIQAAGKHLSQKEIKSIKKEFDISGGVKALAKDVGVNVKKPSVPLPSFDFGFGEGITPAEFDYTSALNLVNAQGNIDTQIANLNKQAAESVANIGLEGTKYTADREKETALGVEGIRTKGALDLQQIVNAGNKEVENIRGEFGLKGKQIDRSTAILGGLVNAFNFS